MAAILIIFLTFCSLVLGQNQTKSKDWPCPLAEEIAPCTCSEYYGPGKISIYCDNVVDINEIERVFSNEFPFNNLHSIFISAQDPDVWEQSNPVMLPPNVFKDKTAKLISIDIKLKEVHPDAFNNTAHLIEEFEIGGPGFVDAINPIEDFPLHILLTFTNLRYLWFQGTNLEDRVFENSKPPFHEMEFEKLTHFSFINGKLSHIPKMCQAPNLETIRLAYHPIASIEPKAFDHLPNLHELDLSGHAVVQPMKLLLEDTLSMSSAVNFSKLEMGEWENLEDFEPGFLKNIQPHAFIDFLDSNIGTISKDAFQDIFEILASYDGEVENPYYPPGHISFGRNPLKCDCSIKWIVEDPKMLQIIDFVDFAYPTSFNRPICRDGTYVADLDLATLEVLCPDD